MLRYILITGLLIGLGQAQAQLPNQEERSRVREGNEAYQNGDYVASEVAYRKASEGAKPYLKGTFNLGDALYRQKRYKEAAQQFQMAADMTQDPEVKADALHNLGNAHLRQSDFPKAIDAYKSALRANPQDEQTRYNLAYALQQLKQQQQQQKQQDEQSSEGENQQDKQQQDDQSDPNKENQKQDQEAENKPPEGQEQEMSPEEIEQMLEALRYQEQKLRKDMQKKASKAKAPKSEKDW